MSRPASAWAIQAPDWGHPPRWLHEGCVRRTRAEAIDAFCKPMGITRPKGWKHLYGRGWRVVRVTVEPAGRLPELSILRVLVEQKHKAALADMGQTQRGSNTEAFAGGLAQAYSHVITLILKAGGRQ
jgi:hypothetical protein